ncbi:MAG: SGNH/GDSL hydrolase family protein [Mariniphaga sp.]|nr:SGNH/GDSL hydrolase family protein [Mariniphaga sp.]
MSISRRNFFKRAIISTSAVASIPAIVSSCISSDNKVINDVILKGDVILFQGDSITDAGREKRRELPNNIRSFGAGYAFISASEMLRNMANQDLVIYNRGISGNKVYQLAERWQKDCLNLKPNVLSILIGVNDYWHKPNGNYDGTPEIYENDFRELLNRTKNEFPNIKLVICEPFILPETNAVDESWIEPFSHYQKSAAKLSEEFSAIWVPFQKVFTEAVNVAPAVFWTEDGVHPSMAGCQLMAETWLKVIGV